MKKQIPLGLNHLFNKSFFKILFIILLFTVSNAMSQSIHKWVKYGDKSFQEKDYYGASLYYREAFDLDTNNIEIINKYATSLRLYNDYALAEKYYAVLWSKDKNRVFPETIFWWATLQKNNGKYQEARKNFLKYSNTAKDKKSFLYLKSIQEIKSCLFAQELMKDTLEVLIKNMGSTVNTVNSDFAAFQSNDDALIFSSLRKSKVVVEKDANSQDFLVQIFKKTDFPKDTVILYLGDKASQNANGTFNLNHSRFYFSRCEPEKDCKIWVKEKYNDKDTLYPLPFPINQEGFTSTHPHIAQVDGEEVLFFSANFNTSIGKFDIWKSTVKENSFSTPQNLGNTINSIDDELCPFYDYSSKRLYFSSNWYEGLGGFDIFYSSLEKNNYQNPINLGYPINSSANDLYYSIYPSSNKAFLTSNRVGAITEKSATCCNDIWQYELEKPNPQPISNITIDTNFQILKSFIPLKLYFHNDEPMPRSKDTLTTLSYEQTYRAYKSLFPNYAREFSKGLSKNESDSSRQVITNFFDLEVDLGMNSLEKLTNSLLTNLQEGKNLEVTIRGFASPLAKTDYNVNLTLRRISSLENYWKSYRNGVLIPYLENKAVNGAYLHLNRIPFGEYKSKNHVIDDVGNTRHSIYSPDAARERRIEIVNVELSHSDSLFSIIRFQQEIFDFGQITSEKDTLYYAFRFVNIGKSPLRIVNVVSDFPDLEVIYPQQVIMPNQKSEIVVKWKIRNEIGKKIQHIKIFTNAKNPTKELTLTYEKIASKP